MFGKKRAISHSLNTEQFRFKKSSLRPFPAIYLSEFHNIVFSQIKIYPFSDFGGLVLPSRPRVHWLLVRTHRRFAALVVYHRPIIKSILVTKLVIFSS